MKLDKKFYIGVVAMFVLSMALGFLIHGLLLHDDYGGLPNVMRPLEDANARFGYMLVAHVLIAAGFTWIYRMGREDKAWLGQGVRFGVAWAVAVILPWYMIYHAVAQFPLELTLKQMGFDTVGVIIMGVVIAFIHR